MSDIKLTVVPVARLDVEELEAALHRVAKVIRGPVELRAAAQMPKGTGDATRGQHAAGPFLKTLIKDLPRLKVLKRVGGEESGPLVPETAPDATVFVTDVDLYTKKTDGVFAVFIRASKMGLVSVRRMKEAFYRRKADPAKQRTRLVKEILRVTGTLKGLPVCPDPKCVQSETKFVVDIDRKDERYCAACWKWLTTGTTKI